MDPVTEARVIARATVMYRQERARLAARPLWRRLLDRVRYALGGE